MSTPAIDYAAELARTRRKHGLDVEVPQHVRDAVAALLSASAEAVDDDDAPAA